MARTQCAVTTDWTRCVTPVGTGNGHLETQFRLEAVDPARAFEVYAFGPQYEAGTAPTAYQPRGGGLVPDAVAMRFIRLKQSPDALVTERSVLFRVGWLVFAARPWLGNGIRWSAVVDLPRDGMSTQHAHNLVIERLAVDGLVGVVGWVMIGTALVAPSLLVFGWRAAPWLLALVLLNTLDMTWFHSGSFYSTAIVAGSAIGRLHPPGHGRAVPNFRGLRETLPMRR